MHELSISSAIVDTVERHAAGRRVTIVNLRLGRMRQVVPDSLAFYFEIVSRGSVCESARLDLELVAALLRCGACQNEWDPAPPPEHDEIALPSFRCPACGAAESETLSGDELEVDSIEVKDQEEQQCIAPR